MISFFSSDNAQYGRSGSENKFEKGLLKLRGTWPTIRIMHDGNGVVIMRIFGFSFTKQYFSINRIPNVHIYVVASCIRTERKII